MPNQLEQAWKAALRDKAEREILRRNTERRRREVMQLVDRRVAADAPQKQGVPA